MESTSNEQAWIETLSTLADRNGVVRVTPAPGAEGQSGDDGSREVRLLALEDDGAIVIEQPNRPGRPGHLEPGDEADVLAVAPTRQWVGRCPVVEAMDYPLNRSTWVQAVRLGPAVKVAQGQRRQLFRMDTRGTRLPPARLSLNPQGPAAGEPTIEARMLNLSGGGVGLSIPGRLPQVKELTLGGRYSCVLDFPMMSEPITVQVKLTRLVSMDGGSLYLGLKFEFKSEAHRRRIEGPVIRFVNDLQRQQIRRQRSR